MPGFLESSRRKRGAKRGSRRSLVQIAVRLDRTIVDRLRSGPRGLSDEIRSRLDRTFKYEALDPVTRELAEGLVNIATLLRFDFETEWHAWPLAFQAFSTAIKERIAAYAPAVGVMAGSGAARDMLRDEPPETLGRMRERDDRRAHAYKHLAEAQKRKSAGFAKHVKKGDTK
jgi:hypothetical protein